MRTRWVRNRENERRCEQSKGREEEKLRQQRRRRFGVSNERTLKREKEG